ncbi:hypothetical protein B0T26DRAFT_720137 [Lasiosphaeria miniovina]|uniref:Uncharacterized protein n=1 Tax=Lasiosphaeria miniovina TaxID=1954250 RepID=A0AA40DMC6_9PEZI|nr:uncharacterized protein B0T26DRAFT_720137 [Lasiosphaeria miniovina]KAK0709009.1 hypothetical protein B0T26DRAFT_720137 [Lasiosphaeria miniovina]
MAGHHYGRLLLVGTRPSCGYLSRRARISRRRIRMAGHHYGRLLRLGTRPSCGYSNSIILNSPKLPRLTLHPTHHRFVSAAFIMLFMVIQ